MTIATDVRALPGQLEGDRAAGADTVTWTRGGALAAMAAALAALAAVAGGLAACDGRDPARKRVRGESEGPPARASSGDCQAAARGELASPGGTGLGEETDARLRAARAEVIVRLCTEDGWPLEAASCYARAQGMRELGRCRLPPEAARRLTEELVRTMQVRLGAAQ